MCWCHSQWLLGFPENTEAKGCREGLEKQKIMMLAGGRLGPRQGTPKDLRLQVCHDGISSGVHWEEARQPLPLTGHLCHLPSSLSSALSTKS